MDERPRGLRARIRSFFYSDNPTVRLAAVTDEIAAEMALDQLRQHGIEATFDGLTDVLVHSTRFLSDEGSYIWVRQGDLARAREVVRGMVELV
jgi:hypothetical protein